MFARERAKKRKLRVTVSAQLLYSLSVSIPLRPSNQENQELKLDQTLVLTYTDSWIVKEFVLTLPSSSSCDVSTPWSGTRSPVKLFVCVSGRLTPLMWDIAAGPLWTLSFFLAARASVLPAAATASSIRREGKSSSCCLSAIRKLKTSLITSVLPGMKNIYKR